MCKLVHHLLDNYTLILYCLSTTGYLLFHTSHELFLCVKIEVSANIPSVGWIILSQPYTGQLKVMTMDWVRKPFKTDEM